MIDLALITSPSPSPLAAAAFEVASVPPLGVAYMAALMRQKGYRVEVADLNLRCCTLKFLMRFLAIKTPRLVGISTLTESYPNAIRIAAIVKAFSREIPVIVGGPHVTFTTQETMSHDCFDFVICGEGELTLLELANCLLRGEGHLEDIPGLCWRRGEHFFRNPPRSPLGELDDLPLPARNLLFLERYHKAGALITGRGCPGRCIFCSAGAMSGGRYRKRSPGEVVLELSLLRRMGVKTFLFVDDSLTADLERLDRILFGMERENIVLPWVCESRVDIEEPGFFRRMARAGCAGVQLGVESGSQEVLNQLKKGISLSQVIAAVEGAAHAGISPLCSFMIGLPGDTVETVMETIQFAVKLKREYYIQAGIAIATPFPGTSLFRDAARLGLTIREEDYSQYNLYTPVMESKHLSAEQIRNLHFESVDRLRRATKPGMESLFPPPPDMSTAEVYDFRQELF
jgi:anaerobic magnesium-protoporphyrin IX monomethyl ester cyclase